MSASHAQTPSIFPLALGPFDRAAVIAYVEAAGDDNPLHRDPAAARQAGFGDIIVPGMLLMAHIARLLEAMPSVAALRALNARFARPVLPGQPMQLSGHAVARARGPEAATILRLKLSGPDGLAVMAEAELRMHPA